MKPSKLNPAAGRLLELLDQAFNKKSWHGTNLRGSVRGLSAEQAGWRPPGGKHAIAAIVVHCAYWKYSVRRRLRGDPRGSFPLKGSDWFDLSVPLSERDWREYVAILGAEHKVLRDAVAGLSPKRITATAADSTVSNLALIHGVAMHDVYHAGQIQHIKGLWKRRQPN